MPPYYIRSNNLALIAYTHDLVMVLSPGNYTHDTIHVIGHMYIGNPPPLIHKLVTNNLTHYSLYHINQHNNR